MDAQIDISKLLEESKFRMMAYWALVIAMVTIGAGTFYSIINDMITKTIEGKILVGVMGFSITFIIGTQVSKIKMELWKLSDVKDTIRIQTSIKLELENLKMINESAYNIDKTIPKSNIEQLILREKEILERTKLTQKISPILKLKRWYNRKEEYRKNKKIKKQQDKQLK